LSFTVITEFSRFVVMCCLQKTSDVFAHMKKASVSEAAHFIELFHSLYPLCLPGLTWEFWSAGIPACNEQHPTC